MGDFKSFERYGHALKTKHGKELKRHIKFDDTLMVLFMDVKINDDPWVRVDLELAKLDNAEHSKKTTQKHAGKLKTTDDAES